MNDTTPRECGGEEGRSTPTSDDEAPSHESAFTVVSRVSIPLLGPETAGGCAKRLPLEACSLDSVLDSYRMAALPCTQGTSQSTLPYLR